MNMHSYRLYHKARQYYLSLFVDIIFQLLIYQLVDINTMQDCIICHYLLILFLLYKNKVFMNEQSDITFVRNMYDCKLLVY